MIEEKKKNILNLKKNYIISSIFLLILILIDYNILDVVYFIILTIYYFKTKNYRKINK